MAEPWLDIDLRLRVGRDDLAVQLRASEPVVGLVGPSGSGKSTILRVLAGLERRAVGELRVHGALWQGGATFVMPWDRAVGWVPQDSLLFPHLDVAANLAYGGGSAEDVGVVARLLELEELLGRAPRHLSGGERQRVALGRALLRGPRLLLLDEPFSALDRPLRARVSARLGPWCDTHGASTVIVTHDEADLAAMVARVWRVEARRLYEDRAD